MLSRGGYLVNKIKNDIYLKMKLILGDNQFFGINHADLDKALKTKEIFMNEDSLILSLNKL